MPNFPIRESGNSQVPLGGTAVASILGELNNVAVDVTSVQVIWKDNAGTTISDETYTVANVSDTATDGGTVTITNPAGTGNYQATYAPPNDGTYTPPSNGLQFSVRIVLTSPDGTADTGAIAFYVVPADMMVSLLVGDAGYASVLCVREELVQGLKKDAFVIASSGQATIGTIKLPDRTTEAIVEVTRNGVATTAYTFDGLDTLTFSPTLTVGNVVKVTRDTKVSDERIAKDGVVVSNIIDSILATRYYVPFISGSVPPIIESAACALTAMRIRERFFGSTGQTPGDPHAIREWDIWMNLLRGIAAGEQSLVGGDGIAVIPKNRGIYVSNKDERPIFSLEDEVDLNQVPANRNYPKDDIDGYST